MLYSKMLVFLLLVAWAAPVRAELVWENKKLELSAGIGQEKAKGVYKFKNTGSRRVVIKSAKGTCCVEATLSKSSYEPGESGELNAVFDVGMMQGVIEKKIYVVITEPEKEIAELYIKVNIPVSLKFEPKYLIWPVPDDRVAKTIELAVLNGAPITLVSASIPDNRFDCGLKQTEPGKYTITVIPKILPGEKASAQMFLKFQYPDKAITHKLPVSIR